DLSTSFNFFKSLSIASPTAWAPFHRYQPPMPAPVPQRRQKTARMPPTMRRILPEPPFFFSPAVASRAAGLVPEPLPPLPGTLMRAPHFLHLTALPATSSGTRNAASH